MRNRSYHVARRPAPVAAKPRASALETIAYILLIALMGVALFIAWPGLVEQVQIRAGVIPAPTAPASAQPTALPTRQPYDPAPAPAAVPAVDAVSTPIPATATPPPRTPAPTCVVDAGGLNLDTSVHVGSDGASIGGAASVGNGSDPCDAATSTVDVAPIAIPLPPLSAQQAAIISAQTRFTPADGIPCGPRDSRRACLDHADHVAPTTVQP